MVGMDASIVSMKIVSGNGSQIAIKKKLAMVIQ